MNKKTSKSSISNKARKTVNKVKNSPRTKKAKSTATLAFLKGMMFINERKKSKKGKSSSSNKKKFLKIGGILAILGIFTLGLFFLLVYIGAFGQIPDQEELEKIKNPTASSIYSSDGKLLGRIYLENRSNVSYENISPYIIKALVATEDSRFYEHKGVDEIALARVFFKTIVLRQHTGGGSTLSQQIAKNIFGREDYGVISMPVNKFREAIIAYRLEQVYTKEEILTLYLNTVPFGENTYGIEVASERFFSKHAKDLSINESATLVGMLKGNTLYNPHLHPERSLDRRNTVLGQMVKAEYLSEEKANSLSKMPLDIHYKKVTYNTGAGAYFREKIRQQVVQWLKTYNKETDQKLNIYTDGLKIYTTLNYTMQVLAEQSMKEHMQVLQKEFETHWKGDKTWNNLWRGKEKLLSSMIKRSERYQKLKAAGYSEKEILATFDKPKKTRVFSYDGDSKLVTITPKDSIKYNLALLRASFVAIDPQNGAVRSWVGGPDFRFFQYDLVTSKRQVGSVFKPIVYSTALQAGIKPFKYYSNEQVTYEDYDNWTPGNADGKYNGYYSMKGALANSVNTVAVKVIMDAGIENVVTQAHKMGIKSDLPEVPSIALGVANISLLEMVSAFATFSAEGVYHEPQMLTSIKNYSGKTLKKYDTPKGVRVMSKENAQIMNIFLQEVINSGTGRRMRSTYRVAGSLAGKTGTTQNGADGWFMSYTPKLATGCWVGAINPAIHFRTIRYGQGSHMALPIVGKFYRKLYSYRTYASMQYGNFSEDRISPRKLRKIDEPMFLEEELRNEGLFHNMRPKFRDELEDMDREENSNKEKGKKKRGFWNRLFR